VLNRHKRASVTGKGRRRPWAGLGLRARLTVTFGLGALALSASMAGLTYFTARQFTLSQRQQADVRQTFLDASSVVTKLRAKDNPETALVESSSDSSGSKSVLVYLGQEYSLHFVTIPTAMRALVVDSAQAATQRVNVDGSSQLVVGVSLPSVQAQYFEVFSLEDLATELRLLGLVLATVALVTTVAGAAVGRLAARRVLLPLVSVSQAAETIAGGRLDTRLEAVRDADLAPLASSFNRMADALQERIRHEARFTSDVSHELRSPLTTLSNALGVLDSHRSDLDPRGRRALELLDLEVRRFQRMVDDLLEISRIDAGSAELLLDEVEVGELIRHAANSTGAGAVPVDVAPETVGVRLLVDKRRIERVVANLVENAAQYAGGATRLAVESAPGAIRLVVADHGPGVSASERDKVFDRFYRGQSAGQRGASNGTGLGLALVAEHVRLHGGRVWVEDGTGAENRFIVELPLPDPHSLHSEHIEDADPSGDARDDAGPRPKDSPNSNGGQSNGATNGKTTATGRYSRR
jgi:two-component system, OmpR family, sensor histidine kinase MtrB